MLNIFVVIFGRVPAPFKSRKTELAHVWHSRILLSWSSQTRSWSLKVCIPSMMRRWGIQEGNDCFCWGFFGGTCGQKHRKQPILLSNQRGTFSVGHGHLHRHCDTGQQLILDSFWRKGAVEKLSRISDGMSSVMVLNCVRKKSLI